jgi:phage shock protein E
MFFKKENAYHTTDGETVRSLLQHKQADVIDVREPDEYKSGHIPGAINIPLGYIPDSVQERFQDKTRPLVVYCHSGMRSRRAAFALVRAGYQDVEDLGPISAWKNGLETTK